MRQPFADQHVTDVTAVDRERAAQSSVIAAPRAFGTVPAGAGEE
jgi:hypothetical protein